MRSPHPSSPTKEGPLAGRALFDALGQAIKRASGPGRARAWRKWAQAIRKDDPRYRLARNVIARANEILSLYRKGARDYANLLVERLDATLPQSRLMITAAMLKPYRRGKPKRALRESSHIIAELRRAHPGASAKELWSILERDDRFTCKDDELICKADRRTLRLRNFPALLSKLRRN